MGDLLIDDPAAIGACLGLAALAGFWVGLRVAWAVRASDDRDEVRRWMRRALSAESGVDVMRYTGG